MWDVFDEGGVELYCLWWMPVPVCILYLSFLRKMIVS